MQIFYIGKEKNSLAKFVHWRMLSGWEPKDFSLLDAFENDANGVAALTIFGNTPKRISLFARMLWRIRCKTFLMEKKDKDLVKTLLKEQTYEVLLEVYGVEIIEEFDQKIKN